MVRANYITHLSGFKLNRRDVLLNIGQIKLPLE